ncbi:MAG: hypothetical protein R3336_04360, partial [Phycisphaeraceae bacterium]|nr:hypothetical protein [Phycisphaeraceae bacterium]
HCARCNRLGRVDRLERVIQAYYDAVVERAGKKLIVRAWNVRPDGMHDSVEMAERMADRLPGKPDDERLVLSFKFTATDFWRYQAWNQSSLVLGDRPVLYELQCQREFEGKGGVPNWQLPLWRDGHPEMGREAMGLADVAGKVNLAGLWAWVRGGGWGGPFIDNETWIDANVTAVPQLADDPALDPGVVARQWVSDRLGVEDEETAEAICKVLEASPDFVLKGFYVGPFARGRSRQWHPNGDLIQDDLIDASAARRMIAELDDDQLDAVVREKQEAVEAVAARRADLQQRVQKKNQKVLEPMLHTLEYTESLFEALRELLAGLIAHRRWRQSEDPTEGERCRRHLFAAQSHWNHHTQRHATLSGAATAFRESGFWELTQRLTEEVDAEAD